MGDERQQHQRQQGDAPADREAGAVLAPRHEKAEQRGHRQRRRDRRQRHQPQPRPGVCAKHARGLLERVDATAEAGREQQDDVGQDVDEVGEHERRAAVNEPPADEPVAEADADGRLAEAPIALCEVQGYAYLAYREAALLAFDLGEKELSKDLETEAERLQKRFEAAFWCDELGTYALALDGAGEPCRVRSSNAGQALFSGIVKRERAERVVHDLFSAEFFTGWGIRTLGARETRFNPISYHNGSVWPHDNALIALGLARYGHSAEALSLTAALFDAAAHMHLRRLPELFCGFERRRGKAPTLYPVACAPQAWAACAPFALLQACLGLEVDAASETVRLRQPRLPSSLESLVVRRLQVGESRLDLLLRRQESSVAVTLLSREGAAEVEVVL